MIVQQKRTRRRMLRRLKGKEGKEISLEEVNKGLRTEKVQIFLKTMERDVGDLLLLPPPQDLLLGVLAVGIPLVLHQEGGHSHALRL
jgi:hypothetical protein